MAEQGSILIRGGLVISMDDRVGLLPRGDVLIESGTIREVAPSVDGHAAEVIDASDMIVLPGLVDTHRHNWQSQLRGMSTDWSLPEYLVGIRGTLGPRYSPEDVYAGTLLGVSEALDSGCTTVLDWAHIMNTPEHADASVAALREFGGRAIFAHGTPNNEEIEAWYQESNFPHPDDIRRVRERHLSSDDGLVTMAMAARGPQHTTVETSVGDWMLARELGLRVTVHVGEGAWGMRHRPVQKLHDAGVLGPDTTFVHANTMSDDELRFIAESGGSVSVAPEVEMHMGHGFPVTGRAISAGIQPCLSVDVVVVIGGDMFSAMRCMLATERALVNDRAIQRGEMVERLTIMSEDVLRFATIEGARACGLDHRIGSLTPGKEADVILLSRRGLNLTPVNNPYGSVVEAAGSGDVDTVLVAGRVVKRDGRLLTVDTAKVREQALASRDALVGRAGVEPHWQPGDVESWSRL